MYDLDILHIKYEDFVEKPVENTKKILNKMGLNFDVERLRAILDGINPNRKYAFFYKENLTKVYKQIRNDELLCKLGYDKLEI